MAAHTDVNGVVAPLPAALTIECGRCHQRIVCCTGCGMRDFVLVDGARRPTRRIHPTTRNNIIATTTTDDTAGVSLCSRVESECRMSAPPPRATPTAFELFCRDAEAQRSVGVTGGASVATRIEEGEYDDDDDERRCGRRRLQAEAWLAADGETRERYETDARALAVAAVTGALTRAAVARASTNAKRRSGGSSSSSGRRKPTASTTPAEFVPASCGVSGTQMTVCTLTSGDGGQSARPLANKPTSLILFRKREGKNYTSESELLQAWKLMTPEEKKPYDNEAAAIRVASRGGRPSRTRKKS